MMGRSIMSAQKLCDPGKNAEPVQDREKMYTIYKQNANYIGACFSFMALAFIKSFTKINILHGSPL